MLIKRRLYRRTEIVEQIRINAPETSGEFFSSRRRVIEGGNFRLEIFNVETESGGEKLFECDLHGTIEIEQTAQGSFSLVCRATAELHKELPGEQK